MKKYYILLAGAILAATIQTQAQTKIGGAGAPDSSAMLEVTGGAGNNKGILLPRISLADITTWGLSGSVPVAGMFVYNTNAAVTGGSGVGTYYWDGTQWVKSTSAAVPGWGLTGNAATNPATNFLGTTDAQPLVLRTNATEQMRVTSTGNVGIGTAAPGAKLQVSGGNQVNMTVENTNGNINGDYAAMNTRINTATGTPIGTVMFAQSLSTETNGGLGVIRTSTPHDLALGANNVERMRITAAGNVGIGTSTPTAKLDVNGTANIAGNVGINNSTPLAPLSFANTTAPKISLYDNNSATEHYGFGISGGQLNYQVMTGAAHSFRTGGKNGDGTELMRIVGSTGNVGIGTVTPAAKLHVSGNNQVNMIVENTSGTIAGDYAGLNTRINSTTGTPIGTMMFALSLPGETNGGLGVIRTSTPHDLALGANNAEFMRINTFGNVGIGTSAPTAKLDVNGTARIQGSAGTPTAITGRDAAGNINNITLGANLSLAGGVLSASGGSSVSGWELSGNTGTNGAFHFIGTNDAQPLVLRTNSAEHMRITADGKIGINNGIPVASLDINGSARISTSLGTPTAITGRDADGYISNITLGANLSLAGGVLSASGGGTAGWDLTGNAGTNPAINFIGTTDAQPLWFRTNNSNKMVLSSDGLLGMNTATPTARIDIVNSVEDETDDIVIRRYVQTNAGAPRFSFLSSSGNEAAPGNIANGRVLSAIVMKGRIGGSVQLLNSIRSIYTGNGTTQLSEFRFLTSGQLGMTINDQQFVGIGGVTPTQRLHVDGNVLAASYLTSSDRRLKTNISDMQNGLSTIMALRPVSYDKKKNISDHNYDRHEIGFIAQEIQKVLPSIVTVGKDADKTLAVSYTELIPVLTKAIQELNTEVETLKAENQKLKNAEAVTAQLMERVKQMEQMMGIKEIEGTSKVAGK